MPVRGRGDDQAALALPDRRQEVHDPRRQVLRVVLQPDPLLRVERGQVVEEDLVLRLLRRLVVDRLDLQQGEVALRVLRRPHLARDRVAGTQVEAPDLRGRDVDVVRPREVVVVRGAQESEAVGQDLQDAFRVDEPVALGLGLQDLEDQLLLAEPREALDAEVARKRVEIRNPLLLQLGQDEPARATGRGRAELARARLRGDVGHDDALALGTGILTGTGTTGEAVAGMAGRWRCAHGCESLL